MVKTYNVVSKYLDLRTRNEVRFTDKYTISSNDPTDLYTRIAAKASNFRILGIEFIEVEMIEFIEETEEQF